MDQLDFVPPSRQGAIKDFHRARLRAGLERILARFTGRSVDLLSYDEVAEQLQIVGRAEQGLRQIPVAAIVGSVGRYNDFSRTFLPRYSSSQDRWVGVKTAVAHISELPAIDVYQIGAAYFVLDGNHRVSIARRDGLDFIDARVTEVRTRVPLAPDDQPDELLIKAEMAAFFRHTQADQRWPEADFRVSAPGQYAHLENHLEVHRYFIEMAENRDLTDEEAAARWYTEAYQPMIQAIREQGILRYFPGRTETDFYVWLARHRALLQHELGLEIKPETIARLAEQVRPLPSRSLYQQILDVIVPDKWQSPQHTDSWSEERLLARYSDHLLADILVPLAASDDAGLAQALLIAQREQAQVLGLATDLADEELGGWFEKQCQTAAAAGHLVQESGDLAATICRRAALIDLIVLDGRFPLERIQSVLQNCARPMLVVPGATAEMARVLLVYEGQSMSQEALFVAAYLGEQWGVALTVLTGSKSMEHAARYLDMHEVKAEFVTGAATAVTIQQTANEHNSDLILLSCNGRRHFKNVITPLLVEGERPLFICP
ncbi:MAG: universal stress protein [Ardenticatenaceae bacterium]|nr:universal stress protein [Ardenticatenaceae bacterium]MCB9444235.1 universal stress protein [Ardenticatenaceae bacterium]